MKVTLQGQACKGLRVSDERRFHVEWANQSQDSADEAFESPTCLRLPCQCFYIRPCPIFFCWVLWPLAPISCITAICWTVSCTIYSSIAMSCVNSENHKQCLKGYPSNLLGTMCERSFRITHVIYYLTPAWAFYALKVTKKIPLHPLRFFIILPRTNLATEWLNVHVPWDGNPQLWHIVW